MTELTEVVDVPIPGTGADRSPPAPAPADHELLDRDGAVVIIRGVILGRASSRRGPDDHTHEGDYAPRSWKCSACRWFEVAIYGVSGDPVYADGTYVVHTLGRSIVPGDITFARVAYADTPDEVIKSLVQWSQPRTGRQRPSLPAASADALDDASRADPRLDNAYASWLDAGLRT